MLNMFYLALEATGDNTQAGGWGQLLTFLPLILIFAVMYFIMIRPQRKKEKAMKELINSMVVGDECYTTGGIVGRVVNIREDEVTIQTSVANTLITFKKAAIANVIKPISDDD